MRDIKNKLTSSKNTKNIQNRKGKSFGYQVLGFGAGGGGNPFIVATGGTITEDGDCKVHLFTGPGTFTVCSAASCASDNEISYVVVAGGGGGGQTRGGGAGAGGFREFKSPVTTYTASPLEGSTPITVTATAFPVVVGDGGASNTQGSNSVFSTITSTGGGNGTSIPGGSGGGANGRFATAGGSGNSPPVTPPQGQNGSPSSGMNTGQDHYAGSGGGGGGSAGFQNPNNVNGGAGGTGIATSISGSSVTRVGGGGGGSGRSTGTSGSNGGAGGPGGGGAGKGANQRPVGGDPGTVNTGGGGGGSGLATPSQQGPGGIGGSGVVIIRYKFQ